MTYSSRESVTLKVAVVGDCGSGKSWFVDTMLRRGELADSGETELKAVRCRCKDCKQRGHYKATAALRILEDSMELDAKSADGSVLERVGAKVEWWDSSGDETYDGCRECIADDCSGVILIVSDLTRVNADGSEVAANWKDKRSVSQMNAVSEHSWPSERFLVIDLLSDATEDTIRKKLLKWARKRQLNTQKMNLKNANATDFEAVSEWLSNLVKYSDYEFGLFS